MVVTFDLTPSYLITIALGLRRATKKLKIMVSTPESQPPHPCDLQLEDLLARCQVTRTRGSGPGGQHRNKVETAIVIKHCLLYTSPSPRDGLLSRMPSSA